MQPKSRSFKGQEGEACRGARQCLGGPVKFGALSRRKGKVVRFEHLFLLESLTGWGEGVGGISSRGWETQEDQAPSGSETSLPAPHWP